MPTDEGEKESHEEAALKDESAQVPEAAVQEKTGKQKAKSKPILLYAGEEPKTPAEMKNLIEAALFMSSHPVKLEDLAGICRTSNIDLVRQTLATLKTEYGGRDTGLEIHESDEGYGMRVRESLENKVMHLVPETDIPPRLLKTLALIAYSQPLKQSELVKVRGNKVYRYLKELRERGFIDGKPFGRTKLLSTTQKFRDYFKVERLKDMMKK